MNDVQYNKVNYLDNHQDNVVYDNTIIKSYNADCNNVICTHCTHLITLTFHIPI